MPVVASRRERVLLIIAGLFLLSGILTLETGSPELAARPWVWAVVLSFGLSVGGAHIFLNRYLPHRDPVLLPAAGLLTGWGLLLIQRLASNFLLRQCLWLVVGTVAMLAIVGLGRDLHRLRRFRYTGLLGGLLLLAATLLFGVNPSGYGPRLWLGAWGVYFQPSELLKLLLVVYLASYLSERRSLIISEAFEIGRWRLPPLSYVGPLFAMFGLAVVLLVWQQDLGAALLFFLTFLAMLYVATGQWGYVGGGLILFLVAGVIGYSSSSRVALRIDTWLNPWPEASDRAYQIVQSLLALGTGGILGQGLGLGHPTLIPAVHTDFVYSAIAEEFGLSGALAVIALYLVVMLRGFRIAAHTNRSFERFLVVGTTIGLVAQAWVIMAGNVKLIPITGVTLPFVSYGGSSLLISYIGLGILLGISGSVSSVRHPRSSSTYSSYLYLVRAVCLAFLALAAVSGYWCVVRARALQVRDDNARRVLREQRIVRGRILDRNGVVLAGVERAGDGIVTRLYPVPDASPVIGYASLRHGTGGAEAAFDSQLRGERGRDAWQAAWDELLHRPQVGRDVQLTLSSYLQIHAQRALAGHAGAVVLIEASTGEVLALASAPTFDPARLEETWEELRDDSSGPLLNRATQGLYQPGSALETVVLAEALTEGVLDLSDPVADATAEVRVNGAWIGCSSQPAEPYTVDTAYRAACPAAFAELGRGLGADTIGQAVVRWRLATPPALEIPTESSDWSGDWDRMTESAQTAAVGQGQLTVSPLQVALIASTLASDGSMPVPRLEARLQDISGEWRDTPQPEAPRLVVSSAVAQALLGAWQRYEGDVAGHLGVAIAGEGKAPHAWFMGVGPPQRGRRYAVAVILEHADVTQGAAEIGVELLRLAVEQ